MFANTPFTTIATAIIRSSRQVLLCKFRKIHKKTPKKRFQHRCFLVNSVKFPITSFLKNASDGCFSINTLYVYCPTSTQKRCHTYFLAEYFFDLNCRLGKRVSSIFQALSQKSIFNPIEHLRLSFFWQK